MVCLSAVGTASSANASEYIANFDCGRLDPAWTGNYRCDSPDNKSGYSVDRVWIQTLERAGCLDYADVWHNLKASWVCFGKGTLASMDVRQDGGWYRAAIRNNNLTYSGLFTGMVGHNQPW